MVRIVWSWWGSNENIALGVYAPTLADAERVFNVCYNYGVVPQDSNFHVMKDDRLGCFGYFQTTWVDLLKVRNHPLLEPILPKTEEGMDKSREYFLRS